MNAAYLRLDGTNTPTNTYTWTTDLTTTGSGTFGDVTSNGDVTLQSGVIIRNSSTNVVRLVPTTNDYQNYLEFSLVGGAGLGDYLVINTDAAMGFRFNSTINIDGSAISTSGGSLGTNISRFANLFLSGNITITGTVDGVDVSSISLNNQPAVISGNVDFGDYDLTSVDKIEFYDTAIYIDGGADGQLDIVADTQINIGTTGTPNIDVGTAGNTVIGGSSNNTTIASDGDISFSGTAGFDDSISPRTDAIHDLGTSSLRWNALYVADITGSTEVVFNEAGADVDFRFETDTNQNAVFIDAGSEHIKFGIKTIYTPSTTQNITAVGNTILANATCIILNPDGNYTLTSTPTIADGTIGQILYIMCANSEANTVTIQDQDTLASSNLQLGSTSRVITGKKVLQLMFDGTDWLEIAYGDN